MLQVRPFLLHRWGGLGNHRYQAGFSGDVYPVRLPPLSLHAHCASWPVCCGSEGSMSVCPLQSWASLHFQVNFTLRATNVGFGYWSHDLGGHLAATPPELYTRY